ncbi:MAG: hypothetical protein AAFY00_12540, partial [Bacteroidota bacterium]
MKTPIEERWVMGLLQIHLPLTFYNLEETECITLDLGMQKKVLWMQEGIYESPISLQKMITTVSGEEHFSLVWDGGFRLQLGQETLGIRFTKRLARLLGLEEIITQKTTYSLVHEFDAWVNHRIILIHCSLIYEVQVNNDNLRVLQSLVTGKKVFANVSPKLIFPGT